MLIRIITQYLTTNKRIVVPQLGAFIVKAPGEGIVFSELLKRDDGVLRGLLQNEGLGELEAAGEIDRFTFEARHAVEHGGEFPLEGFGILKPGPNQTIVFEYRPEQACGSESGAPAQTEEIHPGDTSPNGQSASRTDDSGETPFSEQTVRETRQAGTADQTPIAIPKVSPSAKLNPEPYVKGLRYGKPPKNTDAYTYVSGKRRIDRFMLIAIAAAIIAVLAIAFGYFQMSREDKAETEQLRVPGQQAPAGETPATPAEETTSQTDRQ